MTRIVPALCALIALCLSWLGGCTNSDPTRGYTMISQYRPGIRSVAVPIFQRGKGEFRRDIEIRLTEAITKEIERATPYKITDRSRADTILTGTLKSIDQQVLSFDPRSGTAREIQMRMLIEFTWKDLRNGQVLAETKDLRVSGTYIPPDPFNEDFFLGSEDTVNRAAQLIVEKMAQPW